MTKNCLSCKKELPTSMFWKNAKKHDGLNYECTPCGKGRLKAYRSTEKGKQVSKTYRQKVAGTAREKALRNLAVRRIGNRFRMNISVAARRGKVWEIPLDEYRRLMSMPCNYCGGPLPETAFGLDRLENSKGYTTSNVVPCCSICNYARRDQFTPEEMKRFIGPAISKVRSQRKEAVVK